MSRSLQKPEKYSRADNLFSKGETLRARAQYTQALLCYKKSFSLYAQLYDTAGMLQCKMALGDICRMNGRFALASEYYLAALDFAEIMESPADTADAKTGLGLSFRAEGKWLNALELIRDSKKIYRRRRDSHGTAFSLWAEAGTLRIKGDIPLALRLFRESLKLFRTLKDNHAFGYCLCGLGGTSRIAGNFKGSLNYYEKANSLFTALKDTFGKAYSFCGMGNAFRMREDYQEAFRCFRKATGLYKKIGDQVSYAYTVWGLGTAYKMTGKYDKAYSCFADSLSLFKKTKDPRGIVYSHLGFGELALMEGKISVAKRYLSSALHRAQTYGFSVETCHAETLHSQLTNDEYLKKPRKKSSGNARKSLLGKNRGTCYNQLGLKIKFRGLPFNIP
jgi:tetratricopeptide (TPR) repeat protein